MVGMVTNQTFKTFIKGRIAHYNRNEFELLRNLPSLCNNAVAHVEGTTRTLNVLGLLDVGAQSADEVVGADTGRE